MLDCTPLEAVELVNANLSAQFSFTIAGEQYTQLVGSNGDAEILMPEFAWFILEQGGWIKV